MLEWHETDSLYGTRFHACVVDCMKEGGTMKQGWDDNSK